MALTIKSPSNFVVDVTEQGAYREYHVKEKYLDWVVHSNIYNGSSEIEHIYAGKNRVTDIVLVDSNKNEQSLYGAYERDFYTYGSRYQHQYIGLKSDNTVFTSKTPLNVSSTIKAVGFSFTPTQLLKINTTTHTVSQGYYSDFGIDLYHDGAKLSMSKYTISGNACYAYYLNEYLVAVYNHSNNGAVSLSHFGGEIPYSIRARYLPKNSLLFVNDRSIENMVDSSTPSSSSPSGPTIISSNSIKISIYSSLDSVIFEETIGPNFVK